MSAPKVFLIGVIAVFGFLLFGSVLKNRSAITEQNPIEIIQEVALTPAPPSFVSSVQEEEVISDQAGLLEVDRIGELFSLDSSKLSIVETISYTSRVPWLKDRPAWIADYATHYGTSRHFIARSLNQKPDYFTQKISPGDRFNVFRKDKNLEFYLVADLSHCRMWFYAVDLDENERILLKTYRIGVGRKDSKKRSGYLTPVGKYKLGEKVAIYKPGVFGFYQDQKVEMIRVFGTRWIPFELEIEGCSESAKGFGLHGAPWIEDPITSEVVEDRSKIEKKYESDGCIRLSSEDIEELFAILITRNTTIEIVNDFRKAHLPGVEPPRGSL